MKIYLRELTDLETELDFTESESWVAEAAQQVDETLDSNFPSPGNPAAPGSPGSSRTKSRPVSVHFSLRKVDEVVVVTGRIQTYIQLVCSRCANSFNLPLKPGFSGLYCKDPVMAGVAHLESQGKPAGQNKGFARHAHDQADDELQAEGKDLDITYLAHDFIDLKDVLTEHIQLQVPFQPLCSADCKGICTQCGADLNIGRCACAKLTKVTPFSVLKDLKVSQS